LPRRNKLQQSPFFKLETHTNFWSEKYNGREPLGDPGAFIYLFIYLFICAFEIYTLLRNYAARNDNSFPAFLYNLSGLIGCPETSAKNYHYSLRNNPEESRSHLHGG
jgi:hypothetical protein